MTLQSLRAICVVVCVFASLAFSSTAIAGSEMLRDQHAVKLQSERGNWFLRLPKEEKLTFQGVVSFDEAGMQSGAMLYPAPSAAGFLAAIITHGLIVNSINNEQKNKMQNAADQVLAPYLDVMNNYTHKDLMQRSMEMMSEPDRKRLIPFSERPDGGLLIESVPVFSMTQDQSALVLDNVVSIYLSANPSTAAYQNTVRVISQPMDGTDLVSYWTANDGYKIKEKSAGLFAESLKIVLNDATNETDKGNLVYKTVRYFEGQTEKMERGQLISERCNRRVIKTLRGWLMSMPAKQMSADYTKQQCNDTPISLKQE